MWSRLLKSGIAGAGIGVIIACVFWPQAAQSHETLTTTVLFDREIVRILQKHCVMCHFEGGPSFPLETYEQTWLQARKMRADAIARHMPPWAAFPGYGHFANDNSLTLRETQFIVSWVEGNGPRNAGTVFTNTAVGNATPRKEVRAHPPDAAHWELGDPQLRKQLPANSIEANAPDQIRKVVVDTGFTSERHVNAVEFMPGDRRVVRAAYFTVQETGQWIGAWTPWYSSLKLPKGVAWRVPAGAHIAAEIYYRGANEKVVDQGTLGLFFDDNPATRQATDVLLESKGDTAPAASQKFEATQKISADSSIAALRVETQPGVESIEVSGRKPDGTTDVMLFVKNVRFDWPTPYVFQQPLPLAKGTELQAIAHYRNPDKTRHPGGIRLSAISYVRTGSSK